jgi:hypothetical protein
MHQKNIPSDEYPASTTEAMPICGKDHTCNKPLEQLSTASFVYSIFFVVE